MKGTKLYRDRYTLGDPIASGGFATIYTATEDGREEQIAIKICNKHDDFSYSRSLVREAELIQRFQHPNIVQLYLIPRPDKASVAYANAIELPHHPVFFVMEYLKGGTLETYLQYVERLTPPEAATIALEIARALDHIHLKGYVHNDLKLENIVFRQPVQAGHSFTPVLVDFNTVTRVISPSAATIYIMAPEQLPPGDFYPSSHDDAVKIDVWGLGVVLYRMLSGRLPFSGRNEKSLTDRIRESRPTSLRGLSPLVTSGLDEMVIDGCLAKNPADRLSLLQLAQELKRIGGDGVPAQKGGAPAKTKSRWFSRGNG